MESKPRVGPREMTQDLKARPEASLTSSPLGRVSPPMESWAEGQAVQA